MRQGGGSTADTVTVDFAARPTNVKSMSGFLHSVQALYPPAGAVMPLRPALWRVTAADRFYPDPQNGWPQLYDRLQSIGTRVQLVLSDGWGYPPKVQPPYTNWPAWENYVRDVARANRGRSLSYDVWNEPNIPDFWPGTREQFFETYVRAYRILREELGATVKIGGPSLADTYDKEYITAFLDYCLANNPCEVNFLSWHELDPRESSALGISDRLKDARASFIAATAYQPLRIGAIYINESVGRVSHLRPGDALMYLSQMEAGAADGACRTCWPDSSGVNDCFNNSLDGLLDPQTGSRRPVWWAYKAYADGVTSRVAATSTNHRIAVLASSAAAGSLSPQILLSYFDNRTDTPAMIDINVALKNVKSLAQFSDTNRFRIKIEVLPLNGNGESPLAGPLTLEERHVTAKEGSVTLFLSSISAGSAYQITLSQVLR